MLKNQGSKLDLLFQKFRHLMYTQKRQFSTCRKLTHNLPEGAEAMEKSGRNRLHLIS